MVFLGLHYEKKFKLQKQLKIYKLDNKKMQLRNYTLKYYSKTVLFFNLRSVAGFSISKAEKIRYKFDFSESKDNFVI